MRISIWRLLCVERVVTAVMLAQAEVTVNISSVFPESRVPDNMMVLMIRLTATANPMDGVGTVGNRIRLQP